MARPGTARGMAGAQHGSPQDRWIHDPHRSGAGRLLRRAYGAAHGGAQATGRTGATQASTATDRPSAAFARALRSLRSGYTAGLGAVGSFGGYRQKYARLTACPAI